MKILGTAAAKLLPALLLLLLLLLLLVWASPVAAKKEKGREIHSWYAQAYAQGERGGLITHYWSKGPLFRAETVIAGRRIVTIVNGEYYYTIDSVGGRGVAIRRAPAAIKEDGTRERPFGNEHTELIAAGGERVGTENLGGTTCTQYRLTNVAGRRTVCVSEELGLPIKIVTYQRGTSVNNELSYVNWLSGFPISEAFFEPDPRFEIERLELDEYRERSRTEAVGPAPVLYGHLLWGKR